MKQKKIHLHAEQFDGALHAACGRLDNSKRIVSEDDFENTQKAKRCRLCAAYWWPYGGET